MTMKGITFVLTDDEWKELQDTVRREFGEPLSDSEVEEIVKKEVAKFVRDTYIRSLGA